jgi:tetrahydromethanopterin S-methyltransferase subunit G
VPQSTVKQNEYNKIKIKQNKINNKITKTNNKNAKYKIQINNTTTKKKTQDKINFD